MSHPYVTESFAADEQALLRPYVTNLDQPVFALRNMPEVVKGALFARYSRSGKSLRRLLLDEFAGDLDTDAAQAVSAWGDRDGDEASRAGRLYQRVFDQYGDDSVAQLGGAHVAVEQASNLLTKVLEWGRLAAYLEQSTRYVAYDDKPGGRYRYYRDPDVMASRHAGAYTTTLDAVFDTYAVLLPRLSAWARERFPQEAGTSDAVYRNTIKAKACDVLRGLLPAATVSNVGIFATAQAYEGLLLRLAQHELAEARHIYPLLLGELRRVIPSFLVRVDREDRGVVWARYLAATRADTRRVATELLAGQKPREAVEVELVDFAPGAAEVEVELVTAMLYPHSHLPEAQVREAVERMPASERRRVLAAYTGERRNRRHKPGRALERVWYRFDVCSDYGAFRDLQRHRLLTIEWQPLSPLHGYDTPPEIGEAGVEREWHEAMERQAELWERLVGEWEFQAQYAIGLAWRIRYSMQLNARAALQMLELRTTPQGHPSYRRVCQRMHEAIRDQAGHGAVAAMMSHVDHSPSDLDHFERLESERASEAKRRALEGGQRSG